MVWSSIPSKIKFDHNIQLHSLTINLANINIILQSSTSVYFGSQSLKLWTSTFKVTVQRSTLSINIHVSMSTMILTHGLSAKDEVWISKSNVERRTNPAKIKKESRILKLNIGGIGAPLGTWRLEIQTSSFADSPCAKIIVDVLTWMLMHIDKVELSLWKSMSKVSMIVIQSTRLKYDVDVCQVLC